MNKIEILGRMTKDIELKKGKSDNIYGTFTLAVNRKDKKDETDFIDCVAFGKIAETIAQYTEKGNRLIVEGSLNFSDYTDKEGNKKRSINILVNDFYFVDFKTKKEENENIPF